MPRNAGAVAVAFGVTTTAGGGVNRTRSEIAELRDLPQDSGLLVQQLSQSIGHVNPPLLESIYAWSHATTPPNLSLSCRAPELDLRWTNLC